MRIFVAGGAGVIGRRLIPGLIAAGPEAIATTRSPGRVAEIRALRGASNTKARAEFGWMPRSWRDGFRAEFGSAPPRPAARASGKAA